MPLPNSKQELADWILRRLGAPVINIEIADIQLEDCIDEAVQWYQNWHHDGADRTYRVIALSNDLLDRNNRRHQTLDAPVWVQPDSEALNYSKGSRVMFKADNVSGNRIYVRTDSDYSVLDSENDIKNKDGWELEDVLLKNNDLDILPNGQAGVSVPDSIISVSKVHRIDSFSNAGIYNYEYQYFLNNFDFFFGHGAADGGMTQYYIQKTYVDMIDHMLNTTPAIRYNKHKNRLYLDIDWNRVKRGQSNSMNYYLVECYEVSDPEIYGQVYQDMWLKRYAAALAKVQWGSNLKKYDGTELPGGININGQQIFDEGREELSALEEDVRNNLQLEMDSILIG